MNTLYPGSQSNAALAKKMKAMLEAGHPNEVIRLIKNPKSPLSLAQTVTLAIENPVLNDFFDSDPELNRYWSKRLHKHHFLDLTVYSTDGLTVHSVFDQYKGVYFWGEYKKNGDKHSDEATLALNQACQCNIYSAWQEKIERLRSELRETRNTELIPKIIQTLQAFCSRFWSDGYFNAGIILVGIASVLKADATDELSGMFLEAAVESLYTGLYLLESPVSTQIIQSRYREDGWKKIFEPYDADWKTYDLKTIENHFIKIFEVNFGITAPEITFPGLANTALQKAREIEANFSHTAEIENKPT